MSVVPASFRSRVRAGVEPIARLFGRVGLTPNMLTLIGFAIAVVGACLAATQAWLLAGLVVAFGAIFDLFDGALARATNQTSNFGAFLDSTMDRAGEAVVYIGIAAGCLAGDFDIGAVLSATALAASFLVSYTRAKSESLGFSSGTGMASVGVAPREIRTVLLVLALIAVAFAGPIGPWAFTCPGDQLVLCLNGGHFRSGDIVLGGGLGLITVLATLTTIQRILFTYNQSKSNHQEVNH